MSQVLGVIVIARNGDRTNLYQDPKTYAPSIVETTALGEVPAPVDILQPSSPSFISGIRSDLVDNRELHVRVKAGTAGTAVFDSAIALLQGLYPPTEKNKIVLANETTVMAPLGGYQYVPVETVEPGNDRSMEGWTACPNFQKHVEEFHTSDAFKKKEKDAAPFFSAVRDYVFGRPTTLENSWNLYDYVSTQYMHNRTYAFRLPPRLDEQARALADWHEASVFSDSKSNGIGNVAGRTLLHTVLHAVERISFNHDPLQLLLIETSYQPMLSFFNLTGMANQHKELRAIPDFASALTVELRRGAPPDIRDFLRFRFTNGSAGFYDVHPYGHKADVPLTEFIYRAEGSAISSNKQWMQVCGAKNLGGPGGEWTVGPNFTDESYGAASSFGFADTPSFGFLDAPTLPTEDCGFDFLPLMAGFAIAAMALLTLLVGRRRLAKQAVRLEGEEARWEARDGFRDAKEVQVGVPVSRA
ncbi:histidine phosphatase superfamily [Schizophyllum amplum]|uniref:Histidine phosphatase superfamily n=1 Tax=Schizophyllum amplum TaxID=97359 RepID=A0A550BX28_9AGAR|nr:histidine phosphatase superfamily [Auriculariopsis ampla]